MLKPYPFQSPTYQHQRNKMKMRPKRLKKPPEITGTIFGRLTITGFAGRNKHNLYLYSWLCICGNTGQSTLTAMRNKRTRSCGCYLRDRVRTSSGLFAKGVKKNPLYKVWSNMLQRCHNEKNDRYASYGGRGILVCERWKNSVTTFFEDMGPRPSAKHSIERIDNDKGYSPDNCRWATSIEQGRNKRNNKPVIRSDGVRYSAASEAAESAGIGREKMYALCRSETGKFGEFSYRYDLSHAH